MYKTIKSQKKNGKVLAILEAREFFEPDYFVSVPLLHEILVKESDYVVASWIEEVDEDGNINRISREINGVFKSVFDADAAYKKHPLFEFVERNP